MTVFQAIFLGAVQGLSEFLPISSSGHLVLFEKFFGLESADLSFEIALHLATLLAIIIFFRKEILKLTLKDLVVLAVATLPAVGVGLFFSNLIEQIFVLPNLVILALVITGAFNFIIDKKLESQVAEKKVPKALFNFSFQDAAIIGSFQALAIIPGISRSGSTVMGGLLRGGSRRTAFDFSFFMALPAILGASVLQLFKFEPGALQQIRIMPYLFGSITALIVGLASLSLFKYVIEKAKFEWFGIYCIGLAAVSFVILNF